MDQDFREAMKADLHPQIRFELVDARVSNGSSDRVNVLGTLTIAGVEREVRLEAAATPLDGKMVRVTGSKALRMTQFGIDPPTALAGLIKAHDDIVVHFELLAMTK